MRRHLRPRLLRGLLLQGPVRLWVLSVPKRLRYFMQRGGAVLNMVLRNRGVCRDPGTSYLASAHPARLRRHLAPGCADNGSQDGAAPRVGSMPMYSGSTLMFRRSEPQSNRMGNGPAESRQDNGADAADASSKPSRTATIGHPCVSRASHRLPETV